MYAFFSPQLLSKTTPFLSFSPLSLLFLSPSSMATTTPTKSVLFPSVLRPQHIKRVYLDRVYRHVSQGPYRNLSCKATEVSKEVEPPVSEESGGENWIPVVPLAALPKGERRVIVQDGETVLLLWYKDQVFAIENRSPAEGAYSEGLLNAKLTQDGCIVCPTTDSTFDLRTGEVKEWYPKNPVLRILTPSLRKLFVYPVKIDMENIYVSMKGSVPTSGVSAEILFTGRAQPGVTASDVNIEEVRMVVDEEFEGFGFSSKNELINGKAAIIGFLLLMDFELLTGKGILKGTGILDFIYAASQAFSS